MTLPPIFPPIPHALHIQLLQKDVLQSLPFVASLEQVVRHLPLILTPPGLLAFFLLDLL
jgi:hypothetical protein